MKELHRNEKIRMFLKDYYFGYGNLITILRLVGGPLLILIGMKVFNLGLDKLAIAYSGFAFLYGAYMIFKPYLWVLFRLDSFKTEKVKIEIDTNFLVIKDQQNESKIGFDTFKKILDQKSYFSFVISKSQRLRLPKSLIDKDQQVIIENRIKTHYNNH